jgi:nitrate ABC transporter ATP-binding subunit
MTTRTIVEPGIGRSAGHAYLRLEKLTKTFGRGADRTVAVQNVSVDIAKGEFVSLIGHSGCGKSTVLGMVAGLIAPSAGRVVLDERTIEKPGADRAMVFQNYALLPWLTVEQNVFQAVDAVHGARMPTDRKHEATEYYLRMVKLWDHRKKRPSQLSGGMRQRVSIARAFSVRPRVLLLDEPFGALDPLSKGALHEELIAMWTNEARRDAQTVLMVTHDIDEAIYLSDRIVVMSNGPAATIREVLPVGLDRPREKRELIHNTSAIELKEHLLELLEESFARPPAAVQRIAV